MAGIAAAAEAGTSLSDCTTSAGDAEGSVIANRTLADTRPDFTGLVSFTFRDPCSDALVDGEIAFRLRRPGAVRNDGNAHHGE